MARSWSTWLVAAAVCLLLGGNVDAQQKKSDKRKERSKTARLTAEGRFSRLDANKDGSLSLTEFRAVKRRQAAATVDAVFLAKDRNRDNKLSLAEYRNVPFEEIAIICDTNKDGAVTLKEFMAVRKGKSASATAEKMFRMRDRDGDGRLTAADFKTVMKGDGKDARTRGKETRKQQLLRTISGRDVAHRPHPIHV